jgi:hypothetical protein
MSHTVKSKIKMFDGDLIKDVLKELGVAFEEDATWTGWYARQRERVDVLVPADRDEDRRFGVGFRKSADDELEVVSEDMGGQGSRDLVSRFMRLYSEKAAIRLLEEYGYQVEKLEDGAYRAHSTIRTASKLGRRAARQRKPSGIVQRLRAVVGRA